MSLGVNQLHVQNIQIEPIPTLSTECTIHAISERGASTHLRSGKTKNILKASIDSALLAVEIYNKPRAEFRTECIKGVSP